MAKAIFLGGLFVLALLAAAFVASDIVLPLVFAIVHFRSDPHLGSQASGGPFFERSSLR
jgi:hypothetical protein